jgi:hypothetical protein
MNARLLASLVFVLSSSIAAAADPTDHPAPPPAPASPAAADPTVAITTSPLMLVVPMAELTAEVRLAAKVGISVIGGVGMIRSEATNENISLLEIGGSARYYVTGSFRGGLQIGGEVVYVHASTMDPTVDIKAAGVALSPFIGYKWTHSSGFTLEGQVGPSFMVARAQSTTASAETSAVGPMLNLQAGWSF